MPDKQVEPSESQGWHPLALPLLVFFCAIAVYSIGAASRPYWLDEIYTVDFINRPLSTVFDVAKEGDPALGPYYLFMWAWLHVNDSIVAVRLPSIIAMAAAAAMLAAIGRRLVDWRVGASAAAVFIVLPTTSRYAQEARPYAFAVLFTAVAVYCWWRAHEDKRLLWWCGFSLALILAGFSHPYSLTIVGSLFICQLVLPPGQPSIWRRCVPLIVSVTAAFLVLLPWLGQVRQFAKGPATVPPVALDSVGAIWIELATSWWISMALAVLVVLAVAFALREDTVRSGVVLGASWFLAPLIMLVAFQAFTGSTALIPRYYLAFLPGVALLAGLGIGIIAKRSIIAACVLVALIAVLGIPKQMQVRSVEANGGSDGYLLAAALMTPDLASTPIFAPRTAVWYTVGHYPWLKERLILVELQAPHSLLTVVIPRLRAIAETSNFNSILLVERTGREDSSARLAAANYGFTEYWISCADSLYRFTLFVRPTDPAKPPPASVSQQVATATNGEFACQY